MRRQTLMVVECARAVGRCRRGLIGVTSLGASFLAACTGNDVGEAPGDPRGAGAREQPIRLTGAVQKGPFIVGSTIRVANLDLDTNPTGDVFTAYTRDDQGQFDIEM